MTASLIHIVFSQKTPGALKVRKQDCTHFQLFTDVVQQKNVSVAKGHILVNLGRK